MGPFWLCPLIWLPQLMLEHQLFPAIQAPSEIFSQIKQNKNFFCPWFSLKSQPCGSFFEIVLSLITAAKPTTRQTESTCPNTITIFGGMRCPSVSQRLHMSLGQRQTKKKCFESPRNHLSNFFLPGEPPCGSLPSSSSWLPETNDAKASELFMLFCDCWICCLLAGLCLV